MGVVSRVSLGFRLHPRAGVYQVEGVPPGHRIDSGQVGACTLNALFLLPVRD